MAKNQLPEGVGKKIVEALKRQAESDITAVSTQGGTLSNSIPLTNTTELKDVKFEAIGIADEPTTDAIVEEAAPVSSNIGLYGNSENSINEAGPIFNNERISFPEMQTVQESPAFSDVDIQQSSQLTIKSEQINEGISPVKASSVVNFNMPANVAVLKNLIMTLPVGVTKQTGAQIIRQTLEAMGLPMSSVLKEAQEVQEELNTSTRECLLKIQEYKTNIMQLEQSVQEYQKNINQINDIVSLFLMTDRK